MGSTFRLGQNFDAGGRPHNDVLTAILQGFGLDIPTLGPDAANVGAYTDILV